MSAAFDGAAVPGAAIERLEPAMTNDRKDRHVLAAAVASGAHAVVTLNLKHFPPADCAPLAIEPLHPDAFLLDLYARVTRLRSRRAPGRRAAPPAAHPR